MKALRSSLFFLILGIIAFLSNAMLIPVGELLHNSDLMINPLAADAMIRGHWQPFPFNQDYGGTLLTTIRAFWVFLIQSLIPGSHSLAHMSFSYIIIPWGLALLYTWAAKRIIPKNPVSAKLIGVMTAIHFVFWSELLGNDFYFSFLLLAPFFFVLRIEIQNPMIELPPKKLWLAALLTGFTIYTWRAGMIYAVGFWTPWHLILPNIKRMLKPADAIERFLTLAILFLIAFFFYLEFTGPNLGNFFGKSLRVHSGPNLRMAMMISAIYLYKIHRFILNQTVYARFAKVILGTLIGLLPEILWFIIKQRKPFNWATANFLEAIQSLKTVPFALKELSYGLESMTQYPSPLEWVSFAVFCLSLSGVLLYAWKNKKYFYLISLIGLSVFAFCRVYMSGPSESRYLFPLYPIMLMGLGMLWAQIERRRWLKIGFAVLLVIHGYVQIKGRLAIAQYLKNSSMRSEMNQVIEAFEKVGVPVAISNDYWHSYQYTFMTREEFFIVPSYGTRLPPRGFELALNEKRVGILIHPKENKEMKLTEIELLDRKFSLSFITRVGTLDLYMGAVIGR